ncbi:hypothetical protein [Mitsuaria sp. GD03876]|uniref:hypothetical protein n=1 Tax=Mitsuaria sp. GD03876 TaxID=2975399 RepID=UPI002446FBA3|nr:hypothetical protein [Mitsuaria sp. GD03876]MDH0864553.1 hypothetical protein [Mitsuaria sp. GD03876]
MTVVGWISLAMGVCVVGYVVRVLMTGEVVLASRSTSDTVVSMSSGWPFWVGVAIYAVGAVTFVWIALALLRPKKA